MGGVEHFGTSKRKGRLKDSSRPWKGMDIFWIHPMLITLHYFIFNFGKNISTPVFLFNLLRCPTNFTFLTVIIYKRVTHMCMK